MSRLFAVLISTLLALGAGNAFAQAAYVHDMTGTAVATTGTGAGTTQRALKIGDTVETGSTISTGDKSTAVVKFEDGQVMALSEKTSFRIVDYRFNKQRVSDSSAVFTLLQGGLRFISGVMGATNRNSFRMNVGTATIGIRGTDGITTYDSATQAVFAAVFAGAVDVLTAQGTQNVTVGLFTSVAPGQGPTTPQSIELATPAVQQTMNNLRVRGVPINTQVVVKASAAAAAAAVANAVALAVQSSAQPDNAALKTAAQEAAVAAQGLLATAIKEAEAAFAAAVQEGGAQKPAPAAPPPGPPTGTTGTTSGSTGDTGTTGTPSGGAGSGGGGGGSGTTTPASGS